MTNWVLGTLGKFIKVNEASSHVPVRVCNAIKKGKAEEGEEGCRASLPGARLRAEQVGLRRRPIWAA